MATRRHSSDETLSSSVEDESLPPQQSKTKKKRKQQQLPQAQHGLSHGHSHEVRNRHVSEPAPGETERRDSHTASGVLENSMGVPSVHCHEEPARDEEEQMPRRKLLIACALCLAFMIAEIVGGVLSSRLAIMTDALHLMTDLAGFGISIAAITLARRPATRNMTFGWYRAEVLGALMSVLLVWAITAVLCFMAVERIISGNYEIEAQIMLITSSLGVCINLVMGIQLAYGGHGHSHGLAGPGGHGHSHGGGGGGGGHGHAHGGSSRGKQSHGHSHEGHGHSHGGHGHSHGARSSAQYGSTEGLSAPATTTAAACRASVTDHRGSQDELSASHVAAAFDSVSVASSVASKSPEANSQRQHTRAMKTFSQSGGFTPAPAPIGSAPHDVEAAHRDSCEDEGDHANGDEVAAAPTDMNIRAAIIHILGDLCQSVGVMIAAIIIYFRPDWKIADPICTFTFSVLVLITTLTILRDIVHILMEGTPRHVNYEKVKEDLQKVHGVKSVHDLRIWALTVSKVAVSAHIGFEPNTAEALAVQANARKVLREQYNITDVTIQIEQHTNAMDNCGKCKKEPPSRTTSRHASRNVSSADNSDFSS